MDQGTLAEGIEVEKCGEIDAEEVVQELEEIPEEEKVYRLPKGLVLEEAVKNTNEEVSFRCFIIEKVL